ncbi:MAG: YihY/virulence factor BrkB family protein [Lentisphaerae bacterium]|jgi:membrane protein|nr:YihY/virulence factor BrkB family protein [Lentisphaerota bacterium]
MLKKLESLLNSPSRTGRAANWCAKVVKGFLDNNCSMHAAGLTYFSLLAIVPILCILLLAAKTLNADEYIRTFINGQIDSAITSIEAGQDDDLAAVAVKDEEGREARKAVAQDLGREAREISDKLFERIESFDVGTLGWIGFVMLLWTVISSIGMIEVSFNEIWSVPKSRPIWNRAWLYLSVVAVVAVFGALAVSVPILNVLKNIIVATLGATRLTDWASAGLIWFFDSWIFRNLVTLLFSSLTFAFIFDVMPNCKVRFKSAFKGGLITAVIFGCWLKICAVAQVGVAKSSALYGSFAFLPIVLAWLYMSWQIVLLGANMVRAFDADLPSRCDA